MAFLRVLADGTQKTHPCFNFDAFGRKKRDKIACDANFVYYASKEITLIMQGPKSISSDALVSRTLFSERIQQLVSPLVNSNPEMRTWIAGALKLSESGIYRKLALQTPWTDEDLGHIAEALNISFPDFLNLVANSGDRIVEARVEFADGPRYLKVTLRNVKYEDDSVFPFVAYMKNDEWIVVNAENTPPDSAWSWVVNFGAMPLTRKPVVALLDDQLLVIQTGECVLNDAGLQTMLFEDCDALLAARSNHRIDAYILDWSVGKGNTKELISQIRGTSTGKFAPIFVLTGFNPMNDTELQFVMDAYNCDYALKPAKWDELAFRIRSALRKSDEARIAS